MRENMHIDATKMNMMTEMINSDPELAYIKDAGIRVVCLNNDREKVIGENVLYADIKRVGYDYRWAVPYDYMMIFYAADVLSEATIKKIIRKQLLRIGIDGDGLFVKGNRRADVANKR